MRAVGACSNPTSPQSLAVTRNGVRVTFSPPIGVRVTLLSGAGPWVARNRTSSSETLSGQSLARPGAQIQAPGAGSSCASRFQSAMP